MRVLGIGPRGLDFGKIPPVFPILGSPISLSWGPLFQKRSALAREGSEGGVGACTDSKEVKKGAQKDPKFVKKEKKVSITN